jgi:hypothetical protein
MRPTIWSTLLIPLTFGCTDKTGDTGDSGTSAGGTGGAAADCASDSEDWPDNVCHITADASVSDDLANGAVLAHLDWADQSDVACFPATENLNFGGAHLLYWIDQPEDTTLTATVSPDSGVDVSVYVLQMGTTRFEVPPDVVSVVSCEAGFDQTNDSNPGETESASVIATTNPYNVLIGVAGADGHTTGGFVLDISFD